MFFSDTYVQVSTAANVPSLLCMKEITIQYDLKLYKGRISQPPSSEKLASSPDAETFAPMQY